MWNYWVSLYPEALQNGPNVVLAGLWQDVARIWPRHMCRSGAHYLLEQGLSMLSVPLPAGAEELSKHLACGESELTSLSAVFSKGQECSDSYHSVQEFGISSDLASHSPDAF